MKKNKKNIIICLLTIITLILSSCNANPQIVKEAINYLSSEECNGRHPGTQGNVNAMNYIKTKFEQFNLTSYQKDFLVPNEITLLDIVDNNFSLKNKEGKPVLFERGTDYIEAVYKDLSLNLPITDKFINEDCIFLVDGIEEVKNYKNNNKIKVFLVLSPNFKRNTQTYRDISTTPQIFISNSMYSTLKNNIGSLATININYTQRKTTVNSVAGKIPGKDKNSVLIISAHFDHVGSIGKVIWNGAIDNASGVALLLEIASGLSKSYLNKQPECDIIFCGFNCEETGMDGSKAFTKHLGNSYSNIYNLNLDCIGTINKKVLTIDKSNALDTNANEFVSSLNSFLLESGIETVITQGQITSDHGSFKNGICLSTDYNNKYIHTLQDKKDQIDFIYIKKIGSLLNEFIQKKLSTLTLQNKSVSEQDDFEKEMEIVHKEASKLKFGEYKYVRVGSHNRLVVNGLEIKNMDECEKYFTMDLSIAEKIFNRSSSSVILTLGSRFYEGLEPDTSINLDKVFSKIITLQDLSHIRLSKNESADDSLHNIDFHILNIKNKVDKENYSLISSRKEIKTIKTDKYDYEILQGKNSKDTQSEDYIELYTEIQHDDMIICILSTFNKSFDLSNIESFCKNSGIEDVIKKVTNIVLGKK